MKFRLVQVGRMTRTNGWNLMLGKTFIRSFSWNKKKEADYFLIEANELLEFIDRCDSYSKKLIHKGDWTDPPKDNYLGNL